MIEDCRELIDLNEVPGSFEAVDGISRPCWEAIGKWLDEFVDSADRDRARGHAAYQWLARLSGELDGEYWLCTSERIALFSCLGDRDAGVVVESAEAAAGRVRQLLECEDEGLPHLVLLLDDQDTYYSYISQFYTDEGEYGGSSGCYIAEGFPHIVTVRSGLWAVSIVVTHELVHAYLGPLDVPQWVEEGIAQITEEIVSGSQRFAIDGGQGDRHRRYWAKRGLQEFWQGRSFADPDEGQELSYQLAEVLVRNMVADHRDRFLDFLRQSDAADAGEKAARECLGVSLADCAKTFLGDGDWEPKREGSESG